MKLVGGYLSIPTRAVKAHEAGNQHTAALPRPMSGDHLEALNWIQKTRWAINRDVLAVALQVKDSNVHVSGFPEADGEQLPEAPEGLDLESEEGKRHIRLRAKIHSANNRLAGMRKRVYDMLATAKDLAEFPAIWFPHYADFRGRFYPRPQDLHTQGDSLVKGLLRFAEPVPLGQNGQWWMYVCIASAFGHDKLPLVERVDWTSANIATILECAKDPMECFDFWSKSDSPWEFLALCFEAQRLLDWTMAGNDACDFPSTIPGRLDATCSGLQHLSAMMKDVTSAERVNVKPTGKREDIYGLVAEDAKRMVNVDAVSSANASMAQLWVGRIERNTVKRAVMTTPYGVRTRGIQTQLVADKHCDFVENGKQRYDAAGYLTGIIEAALEGSIQAPRAALEYFRSVAAHLESHDKPMIWDTPSGFTARQAYFQSDEIRVPTLHGSVVLRAENTASGFKRGKQELGAAPNVVHSFDAAHLAMTCVALKRAGIRDLAFIHDSFGTHFGNLDVLLQHTKEQFVRIYNTDTLEQWRQSVIKHSGIADVPEVPPLGDLDVTCVLDSEFFFS